MGLKAVLSGKKSYDLTLRLDFFRFRVYYGLKIKRIEDKWSRK